MSYMKECGCCGQEILLEDCIQCDTCNDLFCEDCMNGKECKECSDLLNKAEVVIEDEIESLTNSDIDELVNDNDDDDNDDEYKPNDKKSNDTNLSIRDEIDSSLEEELEDNEGCND